MPRGIYKKTEEHKKKLSLSMLGKPSPYGMLGKKHGEKFKKDLSKKMLGNKYRVGKPSWNKGLSGYMSGEKNCNWKGGISKTHKTERQLAMETLEYKAWRLDVFERDNFTCQICFEKGGKLNADHIKPWSLYPEFRYDISNGRTLCESCHNKDGWSLFRVNNPRKNYQLASES